MDSRDYLEVQVKEGEGESGGKEDAKCEPGWGRSVVQLNPTQANQTNQQAWGEKIRFSSRFYVHFHQSNVIVQEGR